MIVSASARLSPTAAATAWKNTNGHRPIRSPVMPKVAHQSSTSSQSGSLHSANQRFLDARPYGEQRFLKPAGSLDVAARKFLQIHSRTKGVSPRSEQYCADTAVFLSSVKHLDQFSAEFASQQIVAAGLVQPHT